MGGDGLKGASLRKRGPLPHGDGSVQGEHHLEGDGGEVQQLPARAAKSTRAKERRLSPTEVYPGDFQFQQEASHRRRLQKESFQKGRQAHSTPPPRRNAALASTLPHASPGHLGCTHSRRDKSPAVSRQKGMLSAEPTVAAFHPKNRAAAA